MKNKKNQAQDKKIERKLVRIVENGCGGKKGTKCGVEVYIMPHDSSIQEVK